jgi:Na+-translocating ferredoxin:NAD+ oxidoreductase RnfG subunit
MKKLFFMGALALSVLTFATTKNEVKQEVKQEKTTVIKELTPQQKEALALLIRWWSVSYTNACGTTNTVFFQSDNPDMSHAFIDELAYAVNSTYEDC